MSVRRLQRIVGSIVACLVAAVAVACTSFTADVPAPTNEGGGPDAAAETGDLPPEAGADAADAADAARAGKRVMFLTNATYTGNLGGIAGADTKCSEAARDSSSPVVMGRTFGAWISTSASSPTSRFAKDARPIVAPKGESLAPNGWPELASVPHSSKILWDENGALVTANFVVWTATASNGDALPGGSSSSCGDWTEEDTGTGYAGDADKQDAKWTKDAVTLCAMSGRLYCLEL